MFAESLFLYFKIGIERVIKNGKASFAKVHVIQFNLIEN